MATIINKTTPEIMANRRPTGLDFISITVRGFYFPKQTSFMIGVQGDKFIHFVNDGTFWAFYINDCKDGFGFNMDKPGTYRVDDRALARMFMKSTNKKPSDRLLVKKTTSVHDGNPVFEIYTQHTVDTLILKEKEAAEKRKYVAPFKQRKKITSEDQNNSAL